MSQKNKFSIGQTVYFFSADRLEKMKIKSIHLDDDEPYIVYGDSWNDIEEPELFPSKEEAIDHKIEWLKSLKNNHESS